MDVDPHQEAAAEIERWRARGGLRTTLRLALLAVFVLAVCVSAVTVQGLRVDGLSCFGPAHPRHEREAKLGRAAPGWSHRGAGSSHAAAQPTLAACIYGKFRAGLSSIFDDGYRCGRLCSWLIKWGRFHALWRRPASPGSLHAPFRTLLPL